MKREQFWNIKTDTWHTIEYIGMPADNVHYFSVEREIKEPESAKHIRDVAYESQLLERKGVLEKINRGSRYRIRVDEKTGKNALFEVTSDGEKRKMFDGPTITQAQKGYTFDDDLKIFVYPIVYSEWIACKHPQYAKAFEEEGLPLPYAGIGGSVLIETRDGLILLTRRGMETPVYPARLYPPGGGPKPGENSKEAILQEIREETGLEADRHFDASGLHMMAFISDTRFEGSRHSRPELVARLPTDLSYKQMEGTQQEQIRKKGKETDVWGLEPVPMNPTSLKQMIKLHGREMCPPTEAGLTYELYELRKEEIGPEAAFAEMMEFTKSIRKYKRSVFEVPVQLLED
jgi:8-oxo-dGTP pyrophosphatase MutT (NUDIX family)